MIGVNKRATRLGYSRARKKRGSYCRFIDQDKHDYANSSNEFSEGYRCSYLTMFIKIEQNGVCVSIYKCLCGMKIWRDGVCRQPKKRSALAEDAASF